jgi:Protein of Unknown function (DUF2784)
VAYHALVVLIAAIHFAVLAYVIAGGFVALRWRKTIWMHFVLVAWAAAIVTMPWLVCPLTWSENWARRGARMPTIPEGFINHYIQGVWYPTSFNPFVQVAVGLVVAVSWVMWFAARRQARMPVRHRET